MDDLLRDALNCVASSRLCSQNWFQLPGYGISLAASMFLLLAGIRPPISYLDSRNAAQIAETIQGALKRRQARCDQPALRSNAAATQARKQADCRRKDGNA